MIYCKSVLYTQLSLFWCSKPKLVILAFNLFIIWQSLKLRFWNRLVVKFHIPFRVDINHRAKNWSRSRTRTEYHYRYHKVHSSDWIAWLIFIGAMVSARSQTLYCFILILKLCWTSLCQNLHKVLPSLSIQPHEIFKRMLARWLIWRLNRPATQSLFLKKKTWYSDRIRRAALYVQYIFWSECHILCVLQKFF